MLILRIKRDSVKYFVSCICNKRKSRAYLRTTIESWSIWYNIFLHLTTSSESFSYWVFAHIVYWFANS